MEEEGTLAMLITDSSQILFMNTSTSTTDIYRIIDENAVDKLCDEIISDIKNHVDTWSNFYMFETDDNQGHIMKLLNDLKSVR